MLKYLFYLRRFFYFFYGEKFYKRFNYVWGKYPSKTEIINRIINFKNYKSYLEIGCAEDVTFSKVKVLDKTGVDPVSGGTHRMTSDSFFQSNKRKYGLIFIDGLHTYQQTAKDIKNSLECLCDKGIILLHDCLPSKIWNQLTPIMHARWNGDVWKAIVETRTRVNIDTYTIVADQGLGLIIKRDNRNLLDKKINNFKNLKFKDYYNKQDLYMNKINHEDLEKII